MKRDEAIGMFEKFNDYLRESHYVEYVPISAINDFLNTDWAKENIVIEEKYSLNREAPEIVICENGWYKRLFRRPNNR